MDSDKDDSLLMMQDIGALLDTKYPNSSCGELISLCSLMVHQVSLGVGKTLDKDPHDITNAILLGAVQLEIIDDDSKS